MTDRTPFGFPPRGMREQMAAYYIGMSVGSFRTYVAKEVTPMRVGAMVIYLREDLDLWVERFMGRAGGAPEYNPWDEVLDQPARTPLNFREEKALQHLSKCPRRFEARVWMPSGIGDATLTGLVERGFLDRGPCSQGKGSQGWGITEAGRKALASRGD